MKKLPFYLLLTAVAVVMIYPLLWLVGASFKTNDEIFSSVWFMPDNLDMSVYKSAWETVTPYDMGHYFINTFLIIYIIPLITTFFFISFFFSIYFFFTLFSIFFFINSISFFFPIC